MELISTHRCFNGEQRRYRLHAETLHSDTTVSVYLPPAAFSAESTAAALPALIWLSGLTCSDENAVQKAGSQRLASELGLTLVMPDTSPRGDAVPSDPEGHWDFGHGAGFYVDAEQEPWQQHYRMASYVIEELPAADRVKYRPKMQREIVKTQEDDGSMWDYYMNSYHKPYGVAFSLLALRPSLHASGAPPPE